jgi:hypothetical protein
MMMIKKCDLLREDLYLFIMNRLYLLNQWQITKCKPFAAANPDADIPRE